MMYCSFASIIAIALSASSVDAFVAPQLRSVAFKNQAPLRATAADAIATLEASQAASVNSIAASIPDLAPKPQLSWTSADAVAIGGNIATVDARDAPGPANIAWLSSVCIPQSTSSLTIFNGPLTVVPHLLSRCVVHGDTNTMSVDLDFRPRAYGAYEMVDADGNYPGPEKFGRDAFTYSGNRKDYDTKFGTEEVVAFMQSALASFEGAVSVAPTDLDLLTGGPLAISVTMPLTDANVAAVKSAKEKAAQYWLSWALEDTHAHRPGAPVNSQYVYDSKYRQNAYSALLPVYSNLFGAADGAKLAAAESGPLDEGYVGGGS